MDPKPIGSDGRHISYENLPMSYSRRASPVGSDVSDSENKMVRLPFLAKKDTTNQGTLPLMHHASSQKLLARSTQPDMEDQENGVVSMGPGEGSCNKVLSCSSSSNLVLSSQKTREIAERARKIIENNADAKLTLNALVSRTKTQVVR